MTAGSQPAERDLLPPSVAGLSLRFHVTLGRTTLPLKDLLQMTAGSIIELRKPLAEPVEAVVNGKVLARGQLVVVDGSYALKVLEKV